MRIKKLKFNDVAIFVLINVSSALNYSVLYIYLIPARLEICDITLNLYFA